eukprot:TRINITY_DN29214_c0_g1_i1.p1 TRINITY_DN29214_c0_g1~~TRINITY_DN29214_c0_g1_i1.p1  ORF type:complete len:274 (+),score=42.41 TRINITY_DN29214_c0_g1_i1:42-863(+)
MSVPRRRVGVLGRHLCVPKPASARPKVCLVIGAGAGIGVNVAKRFADGGYFAVLCRRSDGEGLQAAVDDIKASGGNARGFLADLTKPGCIEDIVREVEEEIGDIHVAVYNLGAQIGQKPLEDLSLKQFELGWRMGCEGLFRLAKVVIPRMLVRGAGTILCTSATSAMRGNSGQHSHASSIGGRRLLLQSLNHEFAPRGIHLCHIIVDAAVNAPDTLGKLLGQEGFKKLQETGDSIVQPKELAETYFHLAHQHRSAWTQELDVRPYSTTPWFNS